MDLSKSWQSFKARFSRPEPPKPAPTITGAEARAIAQAWGSFATQQREESYRAEYIERCHELIEAQQMAGSGPWLDWDNRESMAKKGVKVKESNPLLTQGAYGDIELALQNVEWRREVNLSWLEFSRWGIQQIILISRLYYIKNPIIRRLIDVVSIYVFGRGYEVSSPDPDANDVIREFFEDNKSVLGQNALVELEKQKYYDGNLFFCFFADKLETGKVKVRTIDAVEIQDIITDPDDSETAWFYRRTWSERVFDTSTGSVNMVGRSKYYPALGHEPESKPTTIAGIDVSWETPIYHRKCGRVAKWLFGCPIIYPALDWAKSSRRFLEACATVKQGLAQIARTITTKGGQQAMAGMKQQLGTTVGPQTSLWDFNPPAVDASTFVSGPGTTIEAFQTRGASDDPEEVRQYKLMCCMVVGVPETFLGDVQTGNLATATSLDRPTELNFLEKQESWREDLCTIAKYVLKVSMGASDGKLRERRTRGKITVLEARRRLGTDGRLIYEAEVPQDDKIEVMVTFPAIREGDTPALVKAIAEAMTLDNKAGQIIGIDEKVGVELLYRVLGVDKADEIIEEQYPESDYDPDRTQEPEEPAQPVQPAVVPAPVQKTEEALRRLLEALRKRIGKAA